MIEKTNVNDGKKQTKKFGHEFFFFSFKNNYFTVQYLSIDWLNYLQCYNEHFSPSMNDSMMHIGRLYYIHLYIFIYQFI